MRSLAQHVVPSRTALLVIDIQKDFAAPGFVMAQSGMDIQAAEQAISHSEHLIAAARKAGITPWFIRVVTRPETDSRALRRFMIRSGMADEISICRADTTGSEYYRVTPQPGDPEVEKLLYSAFSGTDLETHLKSKKIETLILCGFTTDCCVDATARDAFHRNFDVFIAQDACAAFDVKTHRNALAILSTHCATSVSVQDLITAWTT
ncbi:cysteine hydrolase family protein [Acetobacter thailandicus]|uniref:cysteine hydrolase family protein n=1 Tax=Acetobacter thailandicus TaxID=1502842 RepID=UPI001BA9C0C7|nr:isochorismatase family cysteine hydrolase [Acetobacter thailandicus]MBS0986664.1 cysteine hydrolase [Acetobacter thailandicus]